MKGRTLYYISEYWSDKTDQKWQESLTNTFLQVKETSTRSFWLLQKQPTKNKKLKKYILKMYEFIIIWLLPLGNFREDSILWQNFMLSNVTYNSYCLFSFMMSKDAAIFISVGKQCKWWLWEWGRIVFAYKKTQQKTS